MGVSRLTLVKRMKQELKKVEVSKKKKKDLSCAHINWLVD